MLKHYHLALLFLLFYNCDKSNNQLNTQESLDIILETHRQIYTVRSDTNYAYLKTAEKLIQSLDGVRDSLFAKNNYLIGLDFLGHGQRDSAAVYFHNATDYVKDHIKTEAEVDMFYMAWKTYLDQEQFGDCISISNKFKSLLDKEKNLSWLSLAYYFDESVYKSTKQYDKALESNRLQEDILINSKNAIGSMPAIMLSKAENKYRLHAKEEAYDILEQLLEQEEDLDNNSKRSLFGNYGLYLFEDGNFKKALPYYLEGIKFTKLMTGSPTKKSELANGYANTAEIYIEFKDYEKASAYLDSIKAIGLNNIESRLQLSTLKYELRLAALTNENMDDAFSSLDNSLLSIFDFQKKEYTDKYENDLVALDKAYENEKAIQKDKQEAELRGVKLQSRLFLLLGLTALLTLLGILFYRRRKYRFEKQSLQMQQRLLRSQMNPHFIANVLTTIQTHVENKRDTSINYLVKFSRLLRLVLENSTQNFVPIDKELESLRKYMDLQLFRFPSKFSYSIDLKNIEEDDLLLIPPMLMQPFVENSIEHGFFGISYEGNIRISLSLENKFIACTIEDNGLGLSENESSEKQSISTQLISDFILKATKTKISFIDKKDISKDKTGTVVNFLIPYKLADD